MWGANIPLIYYAFLCSPHLQTTYWLLTTTFALLCSVVTFQPRFSDPHLRPLRAATFGSLAMTTFIPVVHGLVKYGWAVQAERIALRWIVATLVLNTVGAGAYAAKVSGILVMMGAGVFADGWWCSFRRGGIRGGLMCLGRVIRLCM